MKIRTVKLREAHTRPGSACSSFCSILWDQKAQHLLTASSSTPEISVHDPLLPSDSPRIFRHHRDGITALALSPNGTCLASGSIDHSVKLYKFPGGEFETNITRFTLPLRALSFNRSGTMLAAGGDDDGIKLINTVDGTIARVLKGHKGPVTSLAFDPLSEYLASLDSIGTAIIWELQSGEIIHNLKGIAPDTARDMSILNVLSWSPDGETLAIPGLKNDVVMYDRDTAEKLFSLRGDHSEPICFLSWSPNGKYIATSSLDRQVFIWDVDKKLDIDRQKFENRITSMAWKPVGNALGVIDASGKYGIWDSVVPLSMKSPTEDIPSLQGQNKSGLVLFEEEDEEEIDEGNEPSVSGSLSDIGEASDDEPEPSRKRLRKTSDADEDSDHIRKDDSISLAKTDKRLNRHYEIETNVKVSDRARCATSSGRTKMQEAFQPGATPAQPGQRNFLCYNMLGTITTVEHDGYSHIEVDFHDTGCAPRVPSMTDYFGFCIAALSESGSVFANTCKGEKNMCTLMYRPFSSWANNSEWSMRFEGEEVKVVALGTGWVAAATSLNFLRVYSEGGLQRHILSLDGPVVSASGYQNYLAIVTHSSNCLPSNDQVLEFKVMNILKGTLVHKGRLPLTPGSKLDWLGFSEEGQLSSYDSKGFLRVFTSQYGGSWIPIFKANRDQKSNVKHWLVGLNSTKIFCILCKSPDMYPPAMPKPILTLLDVSFPLSSSDLGADALENEFMLNNLRLYQLHKRIEEMSNSGMDITKFDDEAFNLEATQDRCILRLITSCCNGDKLIRADELVKLLSLEKSMRGAIKLVTALKLPNLAERFSSILEEKLLDDSKETLSTYSQLNSGSVKPIEKPESIPVPALNLSAPNFVKKVIRTDKESADSVKPTSTTSSKEANPTETAHIKSGALVCPSNSFLQSSSNQELVQTYSNSLKAPNGIAKELDSNEMKPTRPCNPFKKTAA